jgi:hypothetical protein
MTRVGCVAEASYADWAGGSLASSAANAERPAGQTLRGVHVLNRLRWRRIFVIDVGARPRAGLVTGVVLALLACVPLATSADRAPTRAQALRLVETFWRDIVHRDYPAACRLWARASLRAQEMTRRNCVDTLRETVRHPNQLAVMRSHRVTRTHMWFLPKSTCPDNTCPPRPAMWAFDMHMVSGGLRLCAQSLLVWEGSALRLWKPPTGVCGRPQ